MKIVRLRGEDIMQEGDIAEDRKSKFKMKIVLLAGQTVSSLPEGMRVFRLWPHGDERTFNKEKNNVAMAMGADKQPVSA